MIIWQDHDGLQECEETISQKHEVYVWLNVLLCLLGVVVGVAVTK